MEIERLTEADLGDAMVLSRQAGWNQTRFDWERLVQTATGGCFAGRVDGELVATSTLAWYEGYDLGWLGMVLVEEDHRGNGYGSEMVRRALDEADDRGIRVVGLDATDEGRSIYDRFGFEDVVPVERWGGTLTGGPGTDRVERSDLSNVGSIARFDQQATGVSRGWLFRPLLTSPDVIPLVVTEDDRDDNIHVPGGDDVAAYAIVRPGRTHWHVGPIVGDDEHVGALLDAVAAELDGPDVYVDLFPDAAPLDLLSERGLERERRLTRMLRGGDGPDLTGDSVVAGAGFEWG